MKDYNSKLDTFNINYIGGAAEFVVIFLERYLDGDVCQPRGYLDITSLNTARRFITSALIGFRARRDVKKLIKYPSATYDLGLIIQTFISNDKFSGNHSKLEKELQSYKKSLEKVMEGIPPRNNAERQAAKKTYGLFRTIAGRANAERDMHIEPNLTERKTCLYSDRQDSFT